jgi:predicted membrane-bound dolichyl-phosphate-mannose-protein mannosyltransferase
MLQQYHLKYLLPANLKISQNGNQEKEDIVDLKFRNPFISNKLYSIQTSNLNTWTTEGFNDLQQTYNVQSFRIVNKRIEMEDDEIINIKIYSFNGSLISQNPDLSEIPEGLYIIVAKTKSSVITKKIKI